MPEFLALDGLEYDTAKAGPVDMLLAPPYDVVSEDLRRELAARSPFNIVHIIVPQPAGGLDRYHAAARLVDSWREKGVLRRTGRAFYVLEQRFETGGELLSRTALIGHVRLAPWREGGIFPHEVTLPRPKEDRLNLYRATHVQAGPVFMLFEDGSSAVAGLMERIKKKPPERTAAGPEGAEDRIWKVRDAETISAVETAMAGECLFVADGHHRYETALAYREEAASGGGLPEDHPANFVLAAAVPFSDAGLRILPTHRLVRMDGGADLQAALAGIEKDYFVEAAGVIDRSFLTEPGAGTVALYTSGCWRLLRLKARAREELSRSTGPHAARLNVSEVRHCVLAKFFADVDAAVAEERITYTHDVDEAVGTVDAGGADAAVILAPVSVREMAQAAAAGEVMPPKSTYFYPKIPTGIVLNPLR